MTPSPSLPYCCICANPTYKDTSKLAVLKLNGPPNPTIQATLVVTSSSVYTLTLVDAQAAEGRFIPLSCAQDTGSVLLTSWSSASGGKPCFWICCISCHVGPDIT